MGARMRVCVCVCVCWKLQRAIEIAMSIQLYAYDPIKKPEVKHTLAHGVEHRMFSMEEKSEKKKETH